MSRMMPVLALSLILAASACAAPPEDVSAPASTAGADNLADQWDFGAAADGIRAASCDEGGAPMRGLLPVELTVLALNDKQTEVLASRVPEGAKLAGAWELTSADPNFGGLSGLAAEDDTTLLAITDSGGWVRLGLAGGAPSAAAIGYMRGADGDYLAGKGANDAEGLALRNGIAFVSFERDFRIEAFDIGTCGAGAKAVEIATLPDAFDGTKIDSNAGPEALDLTPAGHLRFGFEAASDGVSPIGTVRSDAPAVWSGAVAANPDGFALVAMETVSLPGGGEREIYLYRAFDPLRGARSVLVWGPGADEQITLSRPVLTDNFEGLTAQVLSSGDVRLWIVSDNNFAKAQRNLIYAFDITL
jgi:hypothetical protein